MSTKPRTVLITGCSAGGIGHALAKEFHSRGLLVFATARTLEAMDELKKCSINTFELDVTDVQSVRRVRQEVSEITGGKLDILVNNAGQSLPLAVTDTTLEEARAIFNVNFFGAVLMVKEFTQLLISSGHGTIVQIGSLSGIMPVPFSAAYNASKAALHSFGDTLRVELAPFNVRVVNVLTGAVQSNMPRTQSLPSSSMYKPMEDLYTQSRIKAMGEVAMPAERYARTVVNETFRSRPRRWLWAGSTSWTMWFVYAFLPKGYFESIQTKKLGINEFKKRLRNSKTKGKGKAE